MRRREVKHSRVRSWVSTALLIGCAVLLIVALLPLLFWTANLIRCGHRPIETSDFAAANSYTLPGDGTYTYYPIFSGYACTLSEVRGRNHNTLASR